MSHATLDPVAFPTFSDEEMTCIAKMGDLKAYSDGEALYKHGDRDFPLFVLKEGNVAIIEYSTGKPRDVVVHGPGAFTGDVSMLTGRPSVISAIARGDCQAYEIPAGEIRRLMGEVPELSDKLLEAFQMRRQLLEASEFQGVRIAGSANSKETLQIREFFYKNKVPHTFLDIDEEAGKEALKEFGATPEETPVIACTEHIAKQPSLGKIADCLGITRTIDEHVHDVVVVGAGPAGLAAAVYGASEGLDTLVVDRMGPGGQAGTSSKIENYMGFPSGLPGAELANRGFLQALKFGASFTAPVIVRSVTQGEDGNYRVRLCTGQDVNTRTVLVATGASYRRLPIENCRRLEGAGVYYSATSVEARACRNSTAIVVGGGNSAGQAAMFLSRTAKEVKIVIRGDDLGKNMSHYLCHRIKQTANIEVMTHTEVEGLEGETHLAEVTLRNNQTDERTHLGCAAVFIFVGAKPHTEWLGEGVALDDHGFVITGPNAQSHPLWDLERSPCELETTLPGVFAAGDVRSGTTKRCAFAAGDGALAITCVHQHLSRQEQAATV
ncbi:MAG: FAD-dependent oxidoreductase [Lacipirellulaceae bacterium]